MDRPLLALGSYGPNVKIVQTCLGIDADGFFGAITQGAVRKYQSRVGIKPIDGIVGPVTWASLQNEFNLPPYEPPPAILTDEEISEISNIAKSSSIAHYRWMNRGLAPIGYVKGIAVSYAAAVRKLAGGHPAMLEMAKANTHNTAMDALAYYAATFNARGMPNETSGQSTLRHVYAFLMGLGMRESSGQHCVGRDTSASNTSSDTAEAGAWQTSWNAHNAKPSILVPLFDEYAAHGEGYVSVYKEGVACSAGNWRNFGLGQGARFQDMSKRQPGFACEFAGVVIRNWRSHYGPIIRREVEIRKEADAMLTQVESV